MNINYENPTADLPQEVVQETTENQVPEQVQEPEVAQSNESQQNVEDLMNMSDEDFEKLDPTAYGYNQTSDGMVDNGEQPTNQEQEVAQPTEAQPTESNQQADVNLEEFHKLVTSEFRANGSTMQLSDPKDIVRAMQMGLNYQKKMQAIKPHLHILKTLEQQGLLQDDRIKFAIDLLNHNPSAISQLIKDSNIDTYELPDVEETPYVPKSQLIDNQQLVFNDTIEELNGYNHGKTILNQVQQWDDKSTTELYENPQLLITLAQQGETGLYQDTMSIIARDRALGKIPESMSDIDAYDTVASILLQNDVEGRYSNKPSTPSHQPTMQQVVGNNVRQGVQYAQKTTPSSAQITRGTTQPSGNALMSIPDILNMRDEDFVKFGSFEQLANSVQFKS